MDTLAEGPRFPREPRRAGHEFGAAGDHTGRWDVLSDLEDAKREQASDLLGRIVAMLTKLCR
jgi:hypothetical protein